MTYIPKTDTRLVTDDIRGSGQTFEQLGLKPELLRGLSEINFHTLTPIQERAIPPILEGRDVIARAKNGTGKTASFIIPALQMLDTTKTHVQALIMAHTRELAMQLSTVAKNIARAMPGVSSRVMCAIGGTPVGEDRERIKLNPLIIIATPGRLEQLITQRSLNLGQCNMVILDEADMLLSSNFLENVQNCLNSCSSPRRQTVLISATFPSSVENFCRGNLHQPVFINAMTDSLLLRGVTQYLAVVSEERFKVKLLSLLLKTLKVNQCIVFVNSVNRCKSLYQVVCDELHVPCLYTHSKMPPDERARIFDDFTHGKARLLIATELFTRGIDIRTVNVVINFDTPLTTDTYLHRIGRSGRYGHLGIAITMVAGEAEKQRFMNIDAHIKGQEHCVIHNLPMDPADIPTDLYDASVIDPGIVPELSQYQAGN
ncbi:putative ATP-dependent RNA helicase p54 [Giardia muris]|uniref:Putative ATP-dependent RNA helicase p54 n=1 Tax=Giardia muris TaxID=5742 RepID=A0A4Z1SSR7_GIAMU|nr:putative ATP-dependent RNA helicase p54 [Giardia muris]|eukprot:TNJ28972.1 putative ATP-dependent RNA helicase p54 [Giardia muris]